ncbi:hypothetical protein [Candidatus Poriferisocius sp.]|uniref:hypothetical protein n=1 Tax=Candidatus Poriferisocius sp. TaxID=3101276 RepID=UPI003B59FAB8
MDVVAAVVWHWWIALALVLGAVPAVIGTIVGYFVKVVAPRYNTRRPRTPDTETTDDQDPTRR